jgi:hypothetical protein
MNIIDKFNLDFITPDSPQETRQQIINSEQSLCIDEWTRIDLIARDKSFLLKELYLLCKIDEAFEESSSFGSAVVEYLMGKWQETRPLNKKIDPEGWHRFIEWYQRIRNLLMWYAACSNWQGIIDVLQFVDNEVCAGKCGEEGKAYYIALHHHFDDNKQEWDLLLKTITSSRNKKYRQLSETFQAILDGNIDVVIKRWNMVFKLWLQQEAKMDWYLAPEATFLYYFALENGISIPLQENQKNHIINFDQQKGKQ